MQVLKRGYVLLGKVFQKKMIQNSCADLEEGWGGGSSPPLEFAKLDIAYITGYEKLVIFHITSTVIRQTESIHKITIK